MKNPAWNDRLVLFATLISALVALTSAFNMRDHVRMVDILSLLFGGIGVGISLGAVLTKMRLQRESAPVPRAPAEMG